MMTQYHAFLSYSHRDAKFAEELHAKIEAFAKPYFARRRLRIFRDDASLPMTTDLWEGIREALDESEFLLVLASRTSAESEWVKREILHFVERRGIECLGILLLDGSTPWTNAEPCDEPPALPAEVVARLGADGKTPLVIDFRAHASADRQRLAWRKLGAESKVAAVAARLLGKPKDEVWGRHIKIQRRRVGGLALSVVMLSAATIAATIFGFSARAARGDAENERDAAQRARLAADELNAKQFMSRTRGALAEGRNAEARLFALAARQVHDSDESSTLHAQVNSTQAFSQRWRHAGLPACETATFGPRSETFYGSSEEFVGELRLWKFA